MRMLALAVVASFFVVACESKPAVDPNAPKSPEWQACVDDVNAYCDCKDDEAGQLDDATAARIKRSTKAARNKALISHERCEATWDTFDPSDPCAK
jgi:hypothetical protein